MFAKLISPSYLSTQNDIDILVRGFRLVLRTARTAPFANIVVHGGQSSPYIDGEETDRLSEKDIEKLVRERTETA